MMEMKYLYRNSENGSGLSTRRVSNIRRFLAFASLCFTFQNMPPLVSRVHAQDTGDQMGNGVMRKSTKGAFDVKDIDQVITALEHVTKFKAGQQPKENLDKLKEIFNYWTDGANIKDPAKRQKYEELMERVQGDHVNEKEYEAAFLQSAEVKGSVATPVGRPVKVKQLAEVRKPLIPVQPFEVGEAKRVGAMEDVFLSEEFDSDDLDALVDDFAEMTEAGANGDMPRSEGLGGGIVGTIEQAAPPGRRELTEDEQRLFGTASREEVNAFKRSMRAGNLLNALNQLPDDSQLKNALVEQVNEILKSGYKRSPMGGIFFGLNMPITEIKGVKISADLGAAATFARFQTAQLEATSDSEGKKQLKITPQDKSVTTISSLQAAVNAAMETWKGGELEMSVGLETISVGDKTVVQLVGKAKLTDASGKINAFDVVFFPGAIAVGKVDPDTGETTLETSLYVVIGLAKVTGLPMSVVLSVEGTPLARDDLPPLSQWEGKLRVNYGPYGIYGLVGTSAPDPLAAALKQEKKDAVWGGGIRAAFNEIFGTAYLPGAGLEIRVVDGRLVPFLNLQFQLGGEKGVE